MSARIRVVIADSHPLTRIGIHTILAAAHDVLVVGEVDEGNKMQYVCRELQPDVVLLALNLPDRAAVDLIADLRVIAPQTRIVVFAARHLLNDARVLIEVGAVAIVLKHEAPATLIRAIRTATQGNMWISGAIARQIVPRLLDQPHSTNEKLSDRERDVLDLAAKGGTNRAIGYALGISEKTVEKHMGKIFYKLGVTSRTAAAVRAKELGLV